MRVYHVKILGRALAVKSVERADRHKRRQLDRQLNVCGMGVNAPIVGVIPVITADDETIAEEITAAYGQWNFQSRIGQFFNAHRTVAKIHAVERQPKVTTLRNHNGNEHDLKILVDDLRIAQ